MVNINDLTVGSENEDKQNIDQDLEQSLEKSNTQERKQVVYQSPQETTHSSHKKKKCNSWLKNFWLFAVLILLVLSLLDMSSLISLTWNSTPLDIWYIFVSLILVFFLFFVRWFIWKTIVGLLFLVVIWWLTGIWVYHGFVHTPSTNTTVLSYDFSSGTDNATILLDSFVSHSYVEVNNLTGVIVSYDWERAFHDISQDESIIALDEEKTWSILDTLDSSTHFRLWSNISYTISLLGVIHRWFFDLTDIVRDTISLQGLWNDVGIVLGEDIGDTIIIKGRYAGAHIIVPENIWIKLYYDKVVWSLATQDFLMINKKEYQSSNYAEADTTVDVFVDSIVGKVVIEYN